MHDAIQTDGSFDALKPAYDENGTEVIYFQWYGGAGSEENLKLTPNRIVIYAFKNKGPQNKSIDVGVIDWNQGKKIETFEMTSNFFESDCFRMFFVRWSAPR